MSQLIECPVGNATSLHSASDTSESDDPSMKTPPPSTKNTETKQSSKSLFR